MGFVSPWRPWKTFGLYLLVETKTLEDLWSVPPSGDKDPGRPLVCTSQWRQRPWKTFGLYLPLETKTLEVLWSVPPSGDKDRGIRVKIRFIWKKEETSTYQDNRTSVKVSTALKSANTIQYIIHLTCNTHFRIYTCKSLIFLLNVDWGIRVNIHIYCNLEYLLYTWYLHIVDLGIYYNCRYGDVTICYYKFHSKLTLFSILSFWAV